MKKSYIKKMAAFVVAAAMTLALAACGSTSAAPAAESAGSAESTAEAGSGKLAKIQEKGKLVVCTDAAWAPFEYIGKDGEVTGVDIEFGKYIAEKLGVKLEISNVAFDSISTYLDNGEADLALACITVTDERKETMDFSEPYTTVLQYMVVLADDEETKTINDLAGKAVGTHLGTTGDFLMSDEITAGVLEGTGAENKQYKALPDAALAIKSGELTAIVCDSVLAENVSANNGDFKCFPISYDDASMNPETENIAAAMDKGDEEFVNKINEILKPIIEDGTIDKWIIQYSEDASNL